MVQPEIPSNLFLAGHIRTSPLATLLEETQ